MKKKFFNRFMMIFLVIIFLCPVSHGFAQEASRGHFAPLSPEFLQWQEEYMQQENSSEDAHVYHSAARSKQSGGYIPNPVDFSHLAKNPPVEGSDTSLVHDNVKSDAGAGVLPSTFDLRNVNGKSYVSSVKDQGTYGTCWAHAAAGAMESNYMMQGNGALDLSEMHLAWFTFKNPDKSRAFGNYSSSSFSSVMNLGGNLSYPTALYARLSGPTSEGELPYGNTQPSKSTPEDYGRVLRLREAYHLSATGASNVNSSEEERNIVKRRVMQNGSVSASYYNDDSAFKKAADGSTSYHMKSTKTNHAVQIVGWNDNYPADNFKTKPKINGAWLIKNSWGSNWYANGTYMGDEGYFWMSYETYLTGGASFIVEESNYDMKVYEYDPLGMCGLWGYGGNIMYAANVFESERNETLTEVGFYTADNNLDYEIDIYQGMSSMPSSSPIPAGKSSSSHSSGTFAFAGYHTVTLDTPVTLSKGEYFSVVVKFTGYGMVPIEKVVSGFSNNAKFDTGSFFSDNGSWWETGAASKINACIKAFTVTGSSPSGAPAKILGGGYLPTGQLNVPYSATLSASGTKTITWSLSGGELPAGLTLTYSTGTISGTPTEVCSKTFTIKAQNSYGEDTKTFMMDVLSLPSITTESLDGYAGYTFSGQLELDLPLSAKWKAETSMPSGLKLNVNTGAITGKPSKHGDYTVKFKATTDLGSATKDVRIVIHEKPKKPSFKTSKMPQGVVDDGTMQDENWYFQDINVEGTYPIDFSVNGELPSGLVINVVDDVLCVYGFPSEAGTFSFTLTAENLATILDGKTVSKKYNIVIKEHPPVFALSYDALPDAIVEEEYTPYTFKLSAGTEPIQWKASGLPTGMTFSNGTLSGTPTKAGDFKVTINVSNKGGKESLKIPLTVLQKPVIDVSKLSVATTDKSYSAKISAKGTTPISWDVSGLPDTLKCSYSTSGNTLTISGTPTSIASYPLEITASSKAGSSSVTPTLNVKGVAPKIKATLKKGYVNTAYDGSSISATGTKPITFEYSISDADKAKFGINSLSDLGLSFTYDSYKGTAEITGSPTKSVKSLPVTLIAKNDASTSPASKNVKLNIAGQKPSFTEPSDSAVNLTVAQSASVSVSFKVTGTPDITFSMNKVSGFTLTKTGEYTATLSGTAPSKEGKTAITITAANADGKATKKINIQTTKTADTDSIAGIPESESEDEDVPEDSIREEIKAIDDPESESESAITFGQERGIDSLSDGQSEMLSDKGYVIVKVLPEMKVSESAMYDIDVELDEKAETGAQLLWFAFPKNNETTGDDEIAEFYDESGAEITCVPDSHKITVGVWLTEGITYEPVIAVKTKE